MYVTSPSAPPLYSCCAHPHESCTLIVSFGTRDPTLPAGRDGTHLAHPAPSYCAPSHCHSPSGPFASPSRPNITSMFFITNSQSTFGPNLARRLPIDVVVVSEPRQHSSTYSCLSLSSVHVEIASTTVGYRFENRRPRLLAAQNTAATTARVVCIKTISTVLG